LRTRPPPEFEAQILSLTAVPRGHGCLLLDILAKYGGYGIMAAMKPAPGNEALK
jgi:hypothetical protein